MYLLPLLTRTIIHTKLSTVVLKQLNLVHVRKKRKEKRTWLTSVGALPVAYDTPLARTLVLDDAQLPTALF
eukprot:SAG31_NODE_16241_length_717_cov_0.970874_1_plen_71_part_00